MSVLVPRRRRAPDSQPQRRMVTITNEVSVNIWDIADCVTIISQQLPFEDVVSLSYVCKLNHRAIWSALYRKISPSLDSITLNRNQYVASQMIQQQLQHGKTVVLVAPLGFGKTLTAVHTISTGEVRNTVIIMPPQVMKVWIGEMNKVNFIHSNPHRSKVLVFDSVRSNHLQYCKDNIDDLFVKHKILLMKYSKWQKLSSNFLFNAELLVVDEYHKTRYSSHLQILGLTGETSASFPECKIVKAGIDDYHRKVPSVEHIWVNLDNDSVGSYMIPGKRIQNFEDNADAYLSSFVSVVGKYRKCALCVGDGAIGKYVRGWGETYFPQHKKYNLLSSTKAVDSFLSYDGDAILCIATTANEGINIQTEALVIIDTDMMGVTRIRQLCGRLARPNNKHPTVYINHIVTGKVAVLKTFYAACYSLHNWTFSFHDYPSVDLLIKCSAIIAMLGHSHLTLPKQDGCVIFDHKHDAKRHKKVLEWWKKNKTPNTCLTEELIATMYI